MRSASDLVADAQRAAEIRALIDDPNVVALRVERVRTWVDRLFAVAVVLGLLFTMISVQQFAAQGFPTFSFTWWTAWLLDPMFSLALIAVLVAEVITARYQVKLGIWCELSKWFFLITVLTMNTWLSFAAGSPSGVILHAAPVVLVFIIACVAPEIRARLTEAVVRAAEEAEWVSRSRAVQSVLEPVLEPSQTLVSEPVTASVADVSAVPPPVVPEPAQRPSEPVLSRSDAELAAVLAAEWQRLDRRPGEARMASQLGVSRTTVRRVLDAIPDSMAAANGAVR